MSAKPLITEPPDNEKTATVAGHSGTPTAHQE